MVAAPADGRETIASSGPRSGFADHTGQSRNTGARFSSYRCPTTFFPADPLLGGDQEGGSDVVKDAITAKCSRDSSAGIRVGCRHRGGMVQRPGRRRLPPGALGPAVQAGTFTLPVVVDVLSHQSSRVGGDLLDAARLAIRLAGTELVGQQPVLRLLQEVATSDGNWRAFTTGSRSRCATRTSGWTRR